MPDFSIPPDIDTSLSRAYGDTEETIRFFCFDVPKWGVTVHESRMLSAWLSRVAGTPDEKTLASVAETLGLEPQEFAISLLEQGCEIVLASNNEQHFAVGFEWLAWCLNNRTVQFDRRDLSADVLYKLLPIDAPKHFQKLFSPDASGGEGNAKAA